MMMAPPEEICQPEEEMTLEKEIQTCQLSSEFFSSKQWAEHPLERRHHSPLPLPHRVSISVVVTELHNFTCKLPWVLTQQTTAKTPGITIEPKVLSQHRASGFPWDSGMHLITYISVRTNQFFYKWRSALIQAKPEFTSESNTEKLTGSTSQTDQAGADSHRLHAKNTHETPASLRPAHSSQCLVRPCFNIWNVFLERNL